MVNESLSQKKENVAANARKLKNAELGETVAIREEEAAREASEKAASQATSASPIDMESWLPRTVEALPRIGHMVIVDGRVGTVQMQTSGICLVNYFDGGSSYTMPHMMKTVDQVREGDKVLVVALHSRWLRARIFLALRANISCICWTAPCWSLDADVGE